MATQKKKKMVDSSKQRVQSILPRTFLSPANPISPPSIGMRMEGRWELGQRLIMAQAGLEERVAPEILVVTGLSGTE